MSRLKGADLGVVLPAGAMNFRGDWSASPSPAYAVDDVVTRNGAPYLATVVPGSIDPAGSGTVVLGGITGQNNNAISNTTSTATAFQVAQRVVVTAIELFAGQAMSSGQAGIASDFATGSNPTFLGQGTSPAIPINTWGTVTLDKPVTLVPGVIYRLVAPPSQAMESAGGRTGALNTTWTTSVHYGGAGYPSEYTGAGTAFRLDGNPWQPLTATAPLNYRGAWSSAAAYAANDVVLRNGVPYSAKVNPSTTDPASTVVSSAGLSITPATGALGGGPAAQPFTPSADMVVSAVTVTFAAGPPTAGTYTIGIASAVGTSITWLSNGAVVNPGNGDVTVTIPTVRLTAGTQYFVVITGVDTSAGTGRWASNNAGIALTGITAGDVKYLANFATTLAGYRQQFSLTLVNPWQPLSPANALNYRGAWTASPSPAYAVNDVVLRNGVSYAAVVAPGSNDPAAAAVATTLASSVQSATVGAVNAGTDISAQEFTATAAINNVDTITVRFNVMPTGSGTMRFGLASFFNESSGVTKTTVPWLTTSGGPAYVDIPISAITAAGVDVTLTLPGLVNLANGTQYCIVGVNVTTNTGSNAGINAIQMSNVPTLTNLTEQNMIYGLSTGTGGVSQVNSSNGSTYQWVFRLQNSGAVWKALASPVEQVNTVAASGTAVTLPDVATATMHKVTLTGNATITLPTPGAGKSFTVELVQDATGGRTVTWATPSGAIRWPGGTAPTITATANAIDVVTFICVGGTNWYGFVAGQAFA